MPPAKFLFETSFDTPEPAPEPVCATPPPPAPTFSKEELAQARAEGFAAGRAAAAAEQTRTESQRLVEALEVIAAGLAALQPQLAEGLAAHARASITIAGAIARKIGGAVARADIAAPVAALVAECLPRLLDEPRIVVRVAESALDHVRSQIARASEQAGYHGKVVLIGDPQLAEPACRVEWADGGAEYDPTRVAAECDAAVARYLAGQATPSQPLSKEPSHG